MSRRMFVRLLVLVGLLAGCPGGGDEGLTPRQACEDAQASRCERIYACLTPEEIAANGLPENQAACVTRLQEAEGCARQTAENLCTGNERYQPSQASTCIDQIDGLACSQVRDPNQALAAVAPACAKVCAIPD